MSDSMVKISRRMPPIASSEKKRLNMLLMIIGLLVTLHYLVL
jgi:hypothetical protein